jgi:hypothetical protein
MTLASGARLGSYDIVAPIGAGCMGDVYRAGSLLMSRQMSRNPSRPFRRCSDAREDRRLPSFGTSVGADERSTSCAALSELNATESLKGLDDETRAGWTIVQRPRLDHMARVPSNRADPASETCPARAR